MEIPKGAKTVQRYMSFIYWLSTHHILPYTWGAKIVNKTVPFLIRKLVK